MEEMRLYRFSPITSKEGLLAAIKYTHFACFKLCQQSFGNYLPVAGNVGIFCHYDSEHKLLTAIRQELTEPSDDPNQKYFRLYSPITFQSQGHIPEATYTHLYIRKPDIYRAQVGDVDFVIEDDEYQKLKDSLLSGTMIKGARIFSRPDLDMVELYDPDIDALGYVSPQEMTEKVRIKLSDFTKL